jgi:hypothetical protein
MDVYWSIERCGWVPCRAPADPLATPWSVAAAPAPEPEPVPDLPHQRPTGPVPVEP